MLSKDLHQGDIVWIVNNKTVNPDDPKYSRPYLILSKMEDSQYLMCFITSKMKKNRLIIERRDLSSGHIDYNPSFVALDQNYIFSWCSGWDKRAALQENKIKEILSKFNKLLRPSAPEILYQPRLLSSPSPVFERGKRRS